jgi:hypothetical protein
MSIKNNDPQRQATGNKPADNARKDEKQAKGQPVQGRDKSQEKDGDRPGESYRKQPTDPGNPQASYVSKQGKDGGQHTARPGQDSRPNQK